VPIYVREVTTSTPHAEARLSLTPDPLDRIMRLGSAARGGARRSRVGLSLRTACFDLLHRATSTSCSVRDGVATLSFGRRQ